jgi:hypothetical protein
MLEGVALTTSLPPVFMGTAVGIGTNFSRITGMGMKSNV